MYKIFDREDSDLLHILYGKKGTGKSRRLIAEANRKIKTLELKAYDAMLNLDKNFDRVCPVHSLMIFYPYFPKRVM